MLVAPPRFSGLSRGSRNLADGGQGARAWVHAGFREFAGQRAPFLSLRIRSDAGKSGDSETTSEITVGASHGTAQLFRS